MNKRKMPLNIRLLRFYFHYLGLLAPYSAAKQIQKIWVRTQRFPLTEQEKNWQAAGSKHILHYRNHDLHYHQWGESDKRVLLVHGWNGRGLQLGAFAQTLEDSGYQVIALDLPGHGASTGSSTNGVECAGAIAHIVNKLNIQTVISHSFGALCTVHAASQGLDINIVTISSPEDVSFLISEFTRTLDVPEKALHIFRRLLEDQFGEDIWQRFKLSEVVKGFTNKGLIIHDENDKLVPIATSELIHRNWKNSQFYRSKGLGHMRILRHDSIVEQVKNFIASLENTGPQQK